MKKFRRSRIVVGHLDKAHWAAIESRLTVGARFYPDVLAADVGASQTAAMALLLGLFETGVLDMEWAVYHEDHHVLDRAYKDGFQPVPFHCAICDAWVESRDDLKYELRGHLREPVQLVD